MRAYLDTNVLIGWFKQNLKRIRNDLPIKTNETIKNLEKFKIIVSDLNLIEIARFLKSSFYADKKEIMLLWNLFCDFYAWKIVKIREISLENVKKLVLNFNFSKSMIIDLLHLQIAKENKAKLITFDKELSRFIYNFKQNI